MAAILPNHDYSFDTFMVIVNPASSNGRTRRCWPKIAYLLKEEGISFNYQFTAGEEDATHLTREALQNGYRQILAVGGDGTINEVLNGFFDAKGKLLNSEAVLSMICMGTGSDLARSLKTLPRNLEQSIKRLKRGEVLTLDAGKVVYNNGKKTPAKRFFLNVAGMGLDGDTVKRINGTTKLGGCFLSFLWGALASLLLHRPKRMKIEIDGEEVMDRSLHIVVVANGQYFGGGMMIAPEASLEDGYFNIVTVDAMNKILLLLKLIKVYRGTHIGDSRVQYFKGRNMMVTSPECVLLEVDGEQPGVTDVQVQNLPASVKVKI